MIEIVITILLAMSTGTACELGTEVDWYQWIDDNGRTAKIIMTLEPNDAQDAWLYQEVDGDYLLFVYREKIEATLDSGRSDVHGECARLIEGK